MKTVPIELFKQLLCEDGESNQLCAKTEHHGYCICVLDKGFVYVGDARTEGDYIYIDNAKNVRKWTGGHGLSWYAQNGFSTDITLDDSGTVKAPANGLKHLILCAKRA